MGNVLTAIKAIIENSSADMGGNSLASVQNRANQMGDALEEYVKNAFADCIGQDKDSVKIARNKTFSYLGNSNNPPDAMLIKSDAIEIKKLETLGTSQLQLNSSYPKNILHSDNPKLCKACRECEDWDEKDMLYVIGQVSNRSLQNIFFVYGTLYCDTREVYEKVENVIKDGLESLDGVEIAETGELGRVNKIDHLEISDLRIRGMWLIKTPFKHFDNLTGKGNHAFNLIALIPEDKYNNFENKKEFETFCVEKGVSITDEQVEDPRNPAKFIKSKLIKYHY